MRNRTSDTRDSATLSAPVNLRIERIVPGGAGLGFADRRALLVDGGAPGDVVEVQPGTRGPFADLVRILEPSPDRVEPECAHYGECGGCDLMHLAYPAQIEAKRSIVLDAMNRTGKSDVSSMLEIVPNPKPFGSRIRATWHPGPDGRATWLARRSHTPVTIDRCLVLDPTLEAARRKLTISADTTGLTNGEAVSVTVSNGEANSLVFTVAGASVMASADAFFQANGALLTAFVSHVVDTVQPVARRSVWDLYAGVGLFSVPLAVAGATVLSVESGQESVALARLNARSALPGSMEVVQSTVESFLATQTHPPDVVVIDPPRTGLSPSASRLLVQLAPRRIVSVSCDPVTFARDHRLFADAGYHLRSLVAFDLYPQTHHVELVGAYQLGGHRTD